jgi:hypothetical protein
MCVWLIFRIRFFFRKTGWRETTWPTVRDAAGTETGQTGRRKIVTTRGNSDGFILKRFYHFPLVPDQCPNLP